MPQIVFTFESEQGCMQSSNLVILNFGDKEFSQLSFTPREILRTSLFHICNFPSSTSRLSRELYGGSHRVMLDKSLGTMQSCFSRSNKQPMILRPLPLNCMKYSTYFARGKLKVLLTTLILRSRTKQLNMMLCYSKQDHCQQRLNRRKASHLLMAVLR